MVQRPASNTEPLLRLNVEATTPELLAGETEELLALIRGREREIVVTLDAELLEILVCPNDTGTSTTSKTSR